MPFYLDSRRSDWYRTDFVDYPELLWDLDPLEPSLGAIDAARGRILQIRNEAEAGFFDSGRWTGSSIPSLDLAFLDRGDVLLNPPANEFTMYESSGPNDSLCSTCQHIDLDYAPTRHYYANDTKRQYYWILGSLRDISRRQFCVLCSFLVKVLELNTSDSELTETEWRFAKVELRAYSHTDTGSSRRKYFRVALLFEDPGLERWGDFLKRDYCISLRSDAAGKYEQRARQVQEVLDLEMIRSWVERCETKHTQRCCRPMALLNPIRSSSLRLLDCWSLEVIHASFEWRYVALSWVWGRFRLSEELSFCLRRRKLATEHLPDTITDAILLVKKMGERYLWVDFICIDQHDEQEMNAQMSQMDQVYSLAILTVIAAAGKDANAGLPGVRPRTRLRGQLDVCMGHIQLTTFLPDPFSQPGTVGRGSAIGDSVWNTRAWTYQETIFSSRRLIFTRHQAYLFCREEVYCEDQLDPHYLEASSMGTFFDFDLQDEMSGERAYTRLVKQYSDRKVTKDEDVLNACFSLLRPISSQLRTPLCWGLPESLFHSVLIWEYEPYDAMKAQFRDSKLAAHHVKPATTHTRTFRARHCFPSWTWASWSGQCRELPPGAFLKAAATFYKQKIDGRLEPLHHSGRDSCVVTQPARHASSMQQWNFGKHHGSFPIPTYNTGRPPHGSDSGLLVFWAISATFLVSETIQEVERFDSKNYTSCTLSSRDESEVKGHWQPLIVPLEWWGRQQQRHQLEHQHQQQRGHEHLFILVASCDDQVAVLLIEKAGQFFKRVSAHLIDHADWLAADNREWKLILLA
jgi:Heterokaryon incompatibility protein (HET)